MLKFAQVFCRPGLVIFFSLLIFFIPDPASSSRKTLTRTEDYIVLTGKDVPDLIGSEISDLRLYSCSNDHCSPIPLQVDKIDANGRYVFTQDKYYDPKRDGTLLDANDELCFMAEDAGDRPASEWKPTLAAKGMEIELRDPLDEGKAWAYLFSEPGAEPAKVPDYVDYQVEGDRVIIRSPQYVLSWKTGRIYYDLMQMLDRSGKLGPDVLDSQRMGMTGSFGKQNIPINIPESLIKTADIAFTDGPVRVIVAQIIVIYFAELKIQWGSEYFIRYYRCGQNNWLTYKFPSAFKNLFQSAEIYWSLDFSPEILGSIYLDVNHPQTLTITSGTVKGVPNDAPHYWWGLYGKNGAVLHALKLDEEIFSFLECSGRWNQNPKAKDRKGDFPGRIEIGFSCREVGEMTSRKDFPFLDYILFPSAPTPSGLRALQNLVEHPLKATAKTLQDS